MQNRNYRVIGCKLMWSTTLLALSGFMAYTTIEAGKEVSHGNTCHPTETGESCSPFTAWGYFVCDGLFTLLLGVGGSALTTSGLRDMGFFAGNPGTQQQPLLGQQNNGGEGEIENDEPGAAHVRML